MSRSWAPLAKQAVVAGLIVAAAVASSTLPWLPVTDPISMWSGVACALGGLLFAGAVFRVPTLLLAELLIPGVDFIAIGLLRFGTGETRSVFLAIIVLPVIWIAANPGRQHIVYPLIGTSITLLLPYVLSPTTPAASELVRLLVALLVCAAAASVTNELARHASSRVDIAQRQRRVAESEIVRAATVQQALLPTTTAGLPTALEVSGACVPAKMVGGDFYDWFPSGTGAAFTLGDVMGKGVGAGMIATAVRSVIRSAINDDDVGQTLQRVGAGLSSGGSDILSAQFTTCFHVRIGQDGAAEWADAGHGLNILRRANGSLEHLRSRDLPIGVGASWASRTTVLADGDTLISISDGVLDLFGDDARTLERFEATLSQQRTSSDIVNAITARAAEAEHPDDVTVLAVTYRPEATAASSPEHTGWRHP